jgi:hypothetical protein
MPERRERGPRGWLFPLIESTYARLAPRDAPPPAPPAGVPMGGTVFASALQPGRGEESLAAVAQDHWIDRLSEYKKRK